MNFLQQRILRDGIVKPGGILKVDSFLNHQMDIELLERIGEEFHRRFADRPITKVLIADQLVPRSMAGWFRDMVHLQEIVGLEKILTHHVTDMNHLFAGCGRLAEVNVEAWNVSAVTDFTGIFEGCSALSVLPSWYKLENNESFG